MSSESNVRTAFLVMDTETIPDGDLVARVKYPDEAIEPLEAIRRAQAEALETSKKQNRKPSEFLPVTFQIPVAAAVLRVGADFSLQALACLDSPQFRTAEIVKKFWHGVAHYNRAKIVTFNGRKFDMPLLELAAYRYGIPARDYFLNSRNRFNGHIDLCDWLSNFGACYLDGGLNLLAKLLGYPGKLSMKGEDVYPAYLRGELPQINDYCLCDTLDTYFVFLRTRIMTGDISPDQEVELIAKAKELLESKVDEFPVVRGYLDSWNESTAKKE